MSFSISERPGVYSSFETSSVITAQNGGIAAVAAMAALGTPGSLYTFTNQQEAEAALGQPGPGKPMTALCRLLFLNGVSKIHAVPVAGTGDAEQNYGDAFNLLSNEEASVMLCDSEDLNIQQSLRNSVKAASEERRERICVLSFGGAETNSDLIERAKDLNSERCVLVAPCASSDFPDSPAGIHLAAATAGAIAAAGGDPALPFNGAPLLGLTGMSHRFSDSDVNALIRGGVTPVEYIAGEASIIRAVTTRTTTGGAEDKTWRELTTVLVADHVISTLRNSLRAKFHRAKNTAATRTAIKSQVTVELEKKKQEQIIDAYAGISAEKSTSDPGICIVDFEFAVSHGLNQIYLRAHILI